MVPGGKKGTEERHMGHASQVLCMAISSDGKYLVWGQGVARWPWGAISQGPGGRVSFPDVPYWVKAASTSCWGTQSPWSGSGGRGGLWVSKVQVSGVPFCLPGYRRQEQADHDLGCSHLQAPAHLHRAPRRHLGELGALGTVGVGLDACGAR